MNKLYCITVLPSGYGEGVMPEMDEPCKSQNDPAWELDYENRQRQQDDWDDHLASLPKHLLHPDLKPVANTWIEHWEEGYQMKSIELSDGRWEDCSENQYKHRGTMSRRIVLIPKAVKDGGNIFYPATANDVSEQGVENFMQKPLPAKDDTGGDGTIIEFLLGEKSFDGLWFGDRVDGASFWWRKYLREYATCRRQVQIIKH